MKIERYTAQINTGNDTPVNLITIPISDMGMYYIEYIISVISDDLQNLTFFKEIVSVRNDINNYIISQDRLLTPPTSLGTSLATSISTYIDNTDLVIDVTGLSGTGSTDNLLWSIVVDITHTYN